MKDAAAHRRERETPSGFDALRGTAERTSSSRQRGSGHKGHGRSTRPGANAYRGSESQRAGARGDRGSVKPPYSGPCPHLTRICKQARVARIAREWGDSAQDAPAGVLGTGRDQGRRHGHHQGSIEADVPLESLHRNCSRGFADVEPLVEEIAHAAPPAGVTPSRPCCRGTCSVPPKSRGRPQRLRMR